MTVLKQVVEVLHINCGSSHFVTVEFSQEFRKDSIDTGVFEFELYNIICMIR